MTKDTHDGSDEQCRGLEETVDAAGMDSFPASDPPAWSTTHLGTPTDAHPGPEMLHDVVQRMRDDVHLLSDTIGERNDRSPGTIENLGRAAALIEERFREAKLPVERRRVDAWASNIEAIVRGGELAEESVVIGAAYDTARGSPGADDNATGVASLVRLAHALREARLARTVRLVAFAAEQPPHAGTTFSGSRRYVDECLREGLRLRTMVNVEALGVFPASERPWPLRIFRALRSDLAIVGDRSTRALLARAERTFKEVEDRIPICTVTFPMLFTGTRTSSQASFADKGIPAFMLTNTASLWPPEYDRTRDTADRIDYERLGRTTRALAAIVKHLASATQPSVRGRRDGRPSAPRRSDSRRSWPAPRRPHV